MNYITNKFKETLVKIYCFDEVYEVFYRAFKETCKIGNSKRIMRVFASIVSPIMFYKLYIIISFISLTRILITVVVICIIWATCCAFLENISLIITRVFEKAWSYIVQRPFFFILICINDFDSTSLPHLVNSSTSSCTNLAYCLTSF